MTRFCRKCKTRKGLDQFDLTRYTQTCLDCSEVTVADALRMLLRRHRTVVALAVALRISVRSARRLLRHPSDMSGAMAARVLTEFRREGH